MNVVITGATKGIGRAIAEKFASEGTNLAICSRNLAELEAFQNQLTQQHPGCEVLIRQTDVSKKEEVLGFGRFIVNHWSKIDILVNNAGVFLSGAIHQEPDGQLEQQIETNLYSAYYLTRALLPNMLANQQGHIFNLCSIASFMAYPNGGSYSISKFALLGFSKVLREELKDKGIRVTALLPGATWSASWDGADLPEERLMPAKDIASAVWNAWQMSNSTVVEEIILRPQLGDL